MRFWSFPKSGKRRRLQLRVENLEHRLTPSVSVSTLPLSPGHAAAGYEMDIVAGAGANTINIYDAGNQLVMVTDASGKMLGMATGVRTIRFEGGTGADNVNY